MSLFFLITNTSNYTYWSQLMTPSKAPTGYQSATEKYGTIFINRHGGYFPCDCIVKVHQIIEAKDFPDKDEPVVL